MECVLVCIQKLRLRAQGVATTGRTQASQEAGSQRHRNMAKALDRTCLLSDHFRLGMRAGGLPPHGPRDALLLL